MEKESKQRERTQRRHNFFSSYSFSTHLKEVQMSRSIYSTAVVAGFMVLFTFLFAPAAVHAHSGGVTFWNKLEGGSLGSPSEIGPDLYFYDPNVDGRTDCCDVIGNVQFVPGKFGNAATLGPGSYFVTARVRALVLHDVSTVLNPEHGTIAVWYNEKERPVGFAHNMYRIFDGGFGLDSPVSIQRVEDGGLRIEVRFGGPVNFLDTDFEQNLNEWLHIAGVWDRNGIDGTSDTVRLYVNGVQVGAIQSKSWGTGFNSNRADIAGGQDLIENKFAIDNLVIYDYAKIDFSDRFHENPVGQTVSTLTVEGDFDQTPPVDKFKVTCGEVTDICAHIADDGPFNNNILGANIKCIVPTQSQTFRDVAAPGGDAEACVSNCSKARVKLRCDTSSTSCDDDYFAEFICSSGSMRVEQMGNGNTCILPGSLLDIPLLAWLERWPICWGIGRR